MPASEKCDMHITEKKTCTSSLPDVAYCGVERSEHYTDYILQNKNKYILNLSFYIYRKTA